MGHILGTVHTVYHKYNSYCSTNPDEVPMHQHLIGKHKKDMQMNIVESVIVCSAMSQYPSHNLLSKLILSTTGPIQLILNQTN